MENVEPFLLKCLTNGAGRTPFENADRHAFLPDVAKRVKHLAQLCLVVQQVGTGPSTLRVTAVLGTGDDREHPQRARHIGEGRLP